MKKQVIIVAGGKGLRMGADLPKQFLPIAGRPVLMHTIEAFYRYDKNIKIIVALPAEQQSYWHALCMQHRFDIHHTICDGGKTRFHSVLNALSYIDEGIVGVHDGVRPFVSRDVIAACYEATLTHKAVVPVIDVYETIREITPEGSRTVPRDTYKLVQTPQVFLSSLLKEAYSQPYNDTFTDDASVVEAMGKQVYLIPGNRENIKITTPADLLLAETLLRSV